jgi:hypothetical protein
MAAALAIGIAVAAAAPGQCTISDLGSFSCDVAVDGDGLTFSLPDGRIFAFALDEDGAGGTGYLIDMDASPGKRPEEVGQLVPVEGKPGCWARDDEFRFCAMVEQAEE